MNLSCKYAESKAWNWSFPGFLEPRRMAETALTAVILLPTRAFWQIVVNRH